MAARQIRNARWVASVPEFVKRTWWGGALLLIIVTPPESKAVHKRPRWVASVGVWRVLG